METATATPNAEEQPQVPDALRGMEPLLAEMPGVVTPKGTVRWARLGLPACFKITTLLRDLAAEGLNQAHFRLGTTMEDFVRNGYQMAREYGRDFEDPRAGWMAVASLVMGIPEVERRLYEFLASSLVWAEGSENPGAGVSVRELESPLYFPASVLPDLFLGLNNHPDVQGFFSSSAQKLGGSPLWAKYRAFVGAASPEGSPTAGRSS